MTLEPLKSLKMLLELSDTINFGPDFEVLLEVLHVLIELDVHRIGRVVHLRDQQMQPFSIDFSSKMQ